jgi:AraC-like DNA-binding protein
MRAAKLVNSYLDAWNHYDASEVASFFSRKGVYFDRRYDEQYSRPALTQYLYDLFSREKQQYQLVGEILVGKSTIAYQYRALDQTTPGSEAAEYGAEFLSLQGDKIINVEVYYSERPDFHQNNSTATRSAIAGKYQKSGLGPQQAEHYKAKLRQVMEVDKLYLTPGLTLPVLAKAMNCTVNHLSQVINGSLGISFYDFVNSYRITEAKHLLLQDSGGRSFVLGIANHVGFNSNSAFYSAFKKDCQQTPLEYRRSHLDR